MCEGAYLCVGCLCVCVYVRAYVFVCLCVHVCVCVCVRWGSGGWLFVCGCVRDLNQSVCLSGQGRVDLLQLMLDAEATEEEVKANPHVKRT